VSEAEIWVAEILLLVSIADVAVSLEVSSGCDDDDNAEYSFEFVVASGVFSMFV
jgi:hypothetical protein